MYVDESGKSCCTKGDACKMKHVTHASKAMKTTNAYAKYVTLRGPPNAGNKPAAPATGNTANAAESAKAGP